MAFHFTLQAVLRYRRTLEENERAQLERLLSRRAELSAQLRRTLEARVSLQSAVVTTLSYQSLRAAEVDFHSSRAQQMAERSERLRAELKKTAEGIMSQRERYLQQRRQRETLESVRSRQLEEYRHAQQRSEQARMEELFLLRRAHATNSDRLLPTF